MSKHPGHLRRTQAGTWEATLSKALGSKSGMTRTFAIKAEAIKWLVLAEAARLQGLPLPEPVRTRVGSGGGARAAGTSFLDVAEAYHRERFVEDRLA